MVDKNKIDNLVIEACLKEYGIVLYRNIRDDVHYLRRMDDDHKELWNFYFSKAEGNYSIAFQKIAEDLIHKEDRAVFLSALNNRGYIEILKDERSFSTIFRRKDGNDYVYEKLVIYRIDEEDTPNEFLFCCLNVDQEIKNKIKEKEINTINSSILKALGKEYSSIYLVNLETSEVVPYNLSDRIEGMFGDQFYRLKFENSVANYIESAVAEDDKSIMQKVLSKKFIIGQLKNQDRFTWVYKNNEDCYCELKCVRVNDEGEPREIVMGFAVRDVEIRVELEEKAQLDFQMSLLDGLSQEYESVWLLKPDKKMRLFRVNDNPEIQRVTLQFYDCEEFDEGLSRFIDKYVVEEDKQKAREEVSYKRIIRSVPQNGVYPVTFRRYSPRGESFVQICFSRAIGPDGEENIVFAFRDVDKTIREQNKRLEMYSEAVRERDMDGLTGLKNRLCYERNLSQIQEKNFNSISCIFVDVDGLHEINNTQGHAAGDELIKYVSQTIAVIWGREYSYRIGGDEFVIFAFDTNEQSITLEVENFTRNILKNSYSVAIGISHSFRENLNIDLLIKNAEKNMYDEKEKHHKLMELTR